MLPKSGQVYLLLAILLVQIHKCEAHYNSKEQDTFLARQHRVLEGKILQKESMTRTVGLRNTKFC